MLRYWERRHAGGGGRLRPPGRRALGNTGVLTSASVTVARKTRHNVARESNTVPAPALEDASFMESLGGTVNASLVESDPGVGVAAPGRY